MKRVLHVLKLCALGALVGALGGAVGAGFAHLLSFVTALREAAPWLVLLLPLGAVVTVLLYRAFHLQDHGGANEIVDCLASNTPIRTMAAPLIFISGGITHLLGGSAGREGAALQLGGAGAAALCRLLRLKEEDRPAMVMSGMSAVFAGLFGTPLTAAVFVLEFKIKPRKIGWSVLPCLIASGVATAVASVLGVSEEALHLGSIAAFSVPVVGKLLVLALGLSVLGQVMCLVFHQTGELLKRLIPVELPRVVLASIPVVIFTILVGDMRYNGSGMSMVITAVEGDARWFDFLLKLLFTAITLAAGLKGGEIVPTFCIGATFGCVLGGVLGLDTGFAAALGLVGLFCCVTNSPLSAICLGIELFGLSLWPYCVLICLILWPLSVKHGLFRNRAFRPVCIGRKAIQ